MLKYWMVIIFGFATMALYQHAEARNINDSMQHHIFCLIDNTVFMESEQDFYLQTLIPHLLSFAKSRGKTITFLPVGNYSSEQKSPEETTELADSLDKAKSLFHFDHRHIQLNDTLKKMNSYIDTLFHQHHVDLNDILVIVISQFLFSNDDKTRSKKPEDAYISGNEYKDLLVTSQIIQECQKKKFKLHLIQLVNQPYTRYVIPESNVMDTIKRNHESLTNGQKKKISAEQKSQLINRWIYALIEMSDTLLPMIYHYQVEKRVTNDLLAITDAIIDPSKIEQLNISLIVDQELFGNSEFRLSMFIENARKQLERKGPGILCNNPLRKSNYRVKKNISSRRHYHAGQKDHYRYYIKQSVLKQHAHISVEHQNVKQTPMNPKEYLSDPGRTKYQIFYQTDSDLISHVLYALQQLRRYQKKDFKVSEKYETLRFNIKEKNLLKGFKVCKNETSCNDIDQHTLLSTDINDTGIFRLRVNLQGRTNLCLVAQPETYEKKFSQLTGWYCGWIDESMLHKKQEENRQVLKQDEPIDVTEVTLPLKHVSFQLSSEMQPYSNTISLFNVQLDEPLIFHTLVSEWPDRLQQFSVDLLPGNYRYDLIFDNQMHPCLNQINQKIAIPYQHDSLITLTCEPDQLDDNTNFLFFKNWRKQEQHIQSAHISGSPNFLKSLLQYTSQQFDRQKSISKDLLLIWKKVYDTLIDSKRSMEGEFKTESYKILTEAAIQLGFVEYGQREIATEDLFFLKRILKKCCFQKHHSAKKLSEKYQYQLDRMEPFLTQNFLLFLGN